MKIGIISMQKIHNYGSFLQAFSLKIQLEKRGHEVYFIDIIPGKKIAEEETQVKGNSIFSKLDKYFFKRIENYFLSKKMAKIHIGDYTKYLETDKKGENQYDLIIIGSDEVFNATAPTPWGFSSQLFGKVDNAAHVVTYAASCGSTTYESAEKYGIVNELYEAMSNLEHISVRDENTARFVKKILNKEPTINLDPVFISNFDQYIPEIKRKKPYLLVYAYGNRICDESEINAIKSYAKNHGLEIISVGMQQRWCKNNLTANAFELLGYIKGAECIVTDTFHGTVFSTKYNKRFISIIRESNRNKLGGLLNQLGLADRSVSDMNYLETVMNTDIDYEEINNIIELEQQRAYDYFDMITNVGE